MPCLETLSVCREEGRGAGDSRTVEDLVAHRFLVRSGVGNLEIKDEEERRGKREERREGDEHFFQEEEREADHLLFERLQGQARPRRGAWAFSERSSNVPRQGGNGAVFAFHKP